MMADQPRRHRVEDLAQREPAVRGDPHPFDLEVLHAPLRQRLQGRAFGVDARGDGAAVPRRWSPRAGRASAAGGGRPLHRRCRPAGRAAGESGHRRPVLGAQLHVVPHLAIAQMSARHGVLLGVIVPSTLATPGRPRSPRGRRRALVTTVGLRPAAATGGPSILLCRRQPPYSRILILIVAGQSGATRLRRLSGQLPSSRSRAPLASRLRL